MQDTDDVMSTAELAALRRLAGIMVPSSAERSLPGADDDAIFADVVRSLGRDRAAVQRAVAALLAATEGRFATLDAESAEAAALEMLSRADAATTALGQAVLQCYYRDDRVMRAVGREPRPPFPKGHAIMPGDWSLLEPVRSRPRMWRDVLTTRSST